MELDIKHTFNLKVFPLDGYFGIESTSKDGKRLVYGSIFEFPEEAVLFIGAIVSQIHAN